MNTDLLAIINQIIAKYGETVLSEPRRVSSLVADLAQDVPKPQKNAFVKCLEHGFVQVLKNAGEAERGNYKQQLAQRLHTEEGFDLGLCGETLDLLIAALFGMAQSIGGNTVQAALTESAVQNQTTARKNICKNCQKELLEGWQTCPFCSTPVQPQDRGPLQAVPGNMVYIQGGMFIMGSPEDEIDRKVDEIQHRVTLSPFYMGKYQVTNEEYEGIVGKNPTKSIKGFNLPVANVSWYDAVEYCNLLSKKEALTPAYDIYKTRRDPNNKNNELGSGDRLKWLVTWDRKANGYRLPTEAEWEYACRAGTTTRYNTGFHIGHNQGSFDQVLPVGSFPSNPWGLYDMHGNGLEWCWDWWGVYPIKIETDPIGASAGELRVVRSSNSLLKLRGYWDTCRSAFRWNFYPTGYEDNLAYLGLRLVRSAL